MGLPRTQWPRRAAGAPPRDQCAALRLPNFLVKARPARPGHCGGNHPGIASAKVDLRALDHQMGSSVRAIGVMQIMQETGTQMKVGDIQKLEPNIHAGVNYLRLMEDAYFDEPGLVRRRGPSSPLGHTTPGRIASGLCSGKRRKALWIPTGGSRTWRRGGRVDRGGDCHLRLEDLQVLRLLSAGRAARAGARRCSAVP